jgi:hypothetical protein
MAPLFLTQPVIVPLPTSEPPLNWASTSMKVRFPPFSEVVPLVCSKSRIWSVPVWTSIVPLFLTTRPN